MGYWYFYGSHLGLGYLPISQNILHKMDICDLELLTTWCVLWQRPAVAQCKTPLASGRSHHFCPYKFLMLLLVSARKLQLEPRFDIMFNYRGRKNCRNSAAFLVQNQVHRLTFCSLYNCNKFLKTSSLFSARICWKSLKFVKTKISSDFVSCIEFFLELFVSCGTSHFLVRTSYCIFASDCCLSCPCP